MDEASRLGLKQEPREEHPLENLVGVLLLSRTLANI